MIRIALALAAVSLLGACSVNRTTTVEAPAPSASATVAPAGSTVITQTPSTTTYSTGSSSTTVMR
jgi:hypothetical protein